jgi:hypothetical protein
METRVPDSQHCATTTAISSFRSHIQLILDFSSPPTGGLVNPQHWECRVLPLHAWCWSTVPGSHPQPRKTGKMVDQATGPANFVAGILELSSGNHIPFALMLRRHGSEEAGVVGLLRQALLRYLLTISPKGAQYPLNHFISSPPADSWQIHSSLRSTLSIV